jgi:hypothetical protein
MLLAVSVVGNSTTNQTAPVGWTLSANETDGTHFYAAYAYDLTATSATVTFGTTLPAGWAIMVMELIEIGAGSLIADATPASFVTTGQAALVAAGGLTPGVVAPPGVVIQTALPPATSGTPVVITVVGGAGVPLRRAWIDAVLPGIVGTEVVHNGSRFGAFYTGPTNTRTAYTDGTGRVGYRYTILRDGGWPAGSFPLASSFEVSAVDTIGNGT